MEETHVINILGQQIRLTSDNFTNFTQILSQSQLLDLYHSLKIPQLNEKILLIMLYYLIKVEKELQEPADYHELCCLKLQEHYIKENMMINIYDYSLICSKVLGKKLIECIHIIYYLIYGRFASKYYVQALVKEKSNPSKKMIFPKRKVQSKLFDKSTHSKTKDQSRKNTLIFENSHTNLELFQQQLKSVLNIANLNPLPFLKESKQKNKKTVQLKCEYKVEEDQHQSSQIDQNTDHFKLKNDKISTSMMKSLPLPSKVHKHQNSSIINVITKKSWTNCLKMKQQMRKQKFTQQFNLQKYIRNTSNFGKLFQNQSINGMATHRISTLNDQNQDSQKQKENKRDIKSSTASNQRSQKKTFDLFKGIASKIKTMNTNLDQIRNNCIQKKRSQEKTIKKQIMPIDKQVTHFIPMKSKMFININECQPIPTAKNMRNSIEIQEFVELGLTPLTPNIKSKGKYSEASSRLDFRDTSNCLTMNKIVGAPATTEQYNPHQSITRKNDSAVKDEETDFMIFGKYNKKSNVKLQQYKEEYRKFMKTQLFDRQRINS